MKFVGVGIDKKTLDAQGDNIDLFDQNHGYISCKNGVWDKSDSSASTKLQQTHVSLNITRNGHGINNRENVISWVSHELVHPSRDNGTRN